MSTIADILREAAEGPTPCCPVRASAWLGFGTQAWRKVMEYVVGDGSRRHGVFAYMTDPEIRSFLILVAEVIDHPQEP
jgi:hypothetical protein